MVARLDCCRDQNVAHLVFSSSAAAYGLPDVERVTEQTPCQPLSPYGESKLIGEWLIRDCTRAWGLNAICLRYFNVAGAAVPELGDPGAFNLIPLVFQALGREQRPQVFGADYPTPDGMGVRDYIHVSDVAHAHLAAARGLQAGAPSATYNIGRGKASASSRCSAPSARSPDSRWTTKSSRGGPVTRTRRRRRRPNPRRTGIHGRTQPTVHGRVRLGRAGSCATSIRQTITSAGSPPSPRDHGRPRRPIGREIEDPQSPRSGSR